MKTRIIVAAAVLAAAAAGAAAPQQQAGYLTPGAFDLLSVLPPAPRDGDPRDQADRAIFRETRALQGTPRWQLATDDVKLSTAALMHDYSCALGVDLTPANAPLTAAFIHRAGIDTTHNTSLAKNVYKRHRPFAADPGPTCEPRKDVEDSYDYPSGHTTLGWTWATLLARLAPDRATAILARGRAFGESRAVCGVHNASAVEAGRLSATATLDAMAGEPAFLADADAARAEINRLCADPATPRPAAAGCAAEAALVAQRVY